MFGLFSKKNDSNKIIKENCKTIMNKDLPIDLSMKSIASEEIQVRTKEEIVSRMIDEFVVAHRANSILNGNSTNDADLLSYVSRFRPSEIAIR